MIFGKHINKYYLKYSLFLLIAIASLITVDYYQLFIPEKMQIIIDAIEDKSINIKLLDDTIYFIIKIVLIVFFGRILWRLFFYLTSHNIEEDLNNTMYKKCLNLSQRYYKKNKTGAIMSLFTNDVLAVKNSFSSAMLMMFDSLVFGGLIIYKMFKINSFLSAITVIPLIILGFLGIFISKKLQKLFLIQQEAFEKMNDFVQENFSGIRVIKAFVKEQIEIKEFYKLNKDNRNKNYNFAKFYIILNVLINLIISIIFIIIIGLGGYFVHINYHNLTIGMLTEYFMYFMSLLWPLMAISQFMSLRSQAKASYQRIAKLLDEKIDITNLNIDNKDLKLNNFKGKIVFKNLDFSYPDSNIKNLNNISFTINPLEKVGIIGKTGCGKSTIVDILLRIYNVDKNKVFLDGYDIMDLDYKLVRNLIGYVPQDNFLFSKDINNNIAFSSEFINKDKVIESSKLAGVYDNIINFENGFETKLGERGVTVSGGQKQRISIARAIYKDPKILILDDSLSAVDVKTEKEILNNFDTISKNKTLIVIAHRISTIKDLDKIIILDEGKIVGYGTYEELKNNNPHFKKLLQIQSLEEGLYEEGK